MLAITDVNVISYTTISVTFYAGLGVASRPRLNMDIHTIRLSRIGKCAARIAIVLKNLKAAYLRHKAIMIKGE